MRGVILMAALLALSMPGRAARDDDSEDSEGAGTTVIVNATESGNTTTSVTDATVALDTTVSDDIAVSEEATDDGAASVEAGVESSEETAETSASSDSAENATTTAMTDVSTTDDITAEPDGPNNGPFGGRRKRSTTVITEQVTEGTTNSSETNSTVAPMTSAEAANETDTTSGTRSTETATQAVTATNATQEETTPPATNTTQQVTQTTETNGTQSATNATQSATNATESVTTTEVGSTTTVTTTTEPPPSIIAQVRSSMKITSHQYASWMALSITSQYKQYTAQLTAIILPVLQQDLGSRFIGMKIVGLRRGSVIVDMDVSLDTQTHNISAVDTEAVAGEISTSLQGIVESGAITFDPDAVEADPNSINLIEPTEAPPSLEELYRSTFIRMEMRAPNANYTDQYNITDSEAFKELELDVDSGMKAMLVKKYPTPPWNITTTLEAAWNDSQKGVGIRFMVEMQPQWANTTESVMTQAKYYVYFSRIGSLQIDPESVKFEDLTTYRPSDGVVVKNDAYYRALRERLYNGSYVGDFTTARPTLRPIVKRHKGYVMGIALPAFLGMLAAVGLLLICTTIAGGNKKAID